jgi:hypothetical protein
MDSKHATAINQLVQRRSPQRQICDLELLMNGGFSPLTTFMNKKDYEVPKHPNLILATEAYSADELAQQIILHLEQEGYIATEH